MNLLNKPHVLMELAVLGDSIHILTEVTSHLKDGQVFKTLDFGHNAYSLVSGQRGCWFQDSGFKFQGREAADFKVQSSEAAGFRFQGFAWASGRADRKTHTQTIG